MGPDTVLCWVPVPDMFRTKLVTKVKPNINSVDVHPQLSNNGHPVDGALVGVGSVCSEYTSLGLGRVWNMCSELDRISSGSLAKHGWSIIQGDT